MRHHGEIAAMPQQSTDPVDNSADAPLRAPPLRPVAVIEFDPGNRDDLFRALAAAPCRVVLIEEPAA